MESPKLAAATAAVIEVVMSATIWDVPMDIVEDNMQSATTDADEVARANLLAIATTDTIVAMAINSSAIVITGILGAVYKPLRAAITGGTASPARAAGQWATADIAPRVARAVDALHKRKSQTL